AGNTQAHQTVNGREKCRKRLARAGGRCDQDLFAFADRRPSIRLRTRRRRKRLVEPGRNGRMEQRRCRQTIHGYPERQIRLRPTIRPGRNTWFLGMSKIWASQRQNQCLSRRSENPRKNDLLRGPKQSQKPPPAADYALGRESPACGQG